MEVENSPFGDKQHIFRSDPIFHFHDYGRKSVSNPPGRKASPRRGPETSVVPGEKAQQGIFFSSPQGLDRYTREN